MTGANAQTECALHWFPDEDQAEARDAARQGTAEASWTLAADTGDSDMDKAEMLQRIQQLGSTKQGLPDRVSILEAELQQVMDRLELLKPVRRILRCPQRENPRWRERVPQESALPH